MFFWLQFMSNCLVFIYFLLARLRREKCFRDFFSLKRWKLYKENFTVKLSRIKEGFFDMAVIYFKIFLWYKNLINFGQFPSLEWNWFFFWNCADVEEIKIVSWNFMYIRNFFCTGIYVVFLHFLQLNEEAFLSRAEFQ